MEQTILPVEAIRERDIDLLIIEELHSDNSFAKWFVSELEVPKLSEFIGVWRSITGFGLGETDILFSYMSENRKVILLIENKLDASFQDEQYNRYGKRAIEYLNDKKCDEAYCVLTAPALYCKNQNDFEYFVSYEAMAKRFESNGTKRDLFKTKLLQIAIEKLRRGYQPINSEPVQKFWQQYWIYKEQNYPSLIMKKPGIVPQNSDWPMLFEDELKNIVFYHKLGQGNTDCTFKGFSEEIELRIKENLPEWARFEKHGRSFSIRVFSGKIDRNKSFADQVELVERGLQNLTKMRNWIIENKNWL
jgi:hypothetical protein